MRWTIIALAVLALLLVGCAGPQGIEVVDEQDTTESVDETIEEVEDESPAAEEIAEETAEETAEEEEAEEEVPEEEEVEAETSEKEFKVKEGDILEYDGKSIEVQDINKYGSEVYLKEGPNLIKLSGTQSPEIANGIEYKITRNTFNENQLVTVTIKPLELGTDEYLLSYGEKVTVNNTVIQLGEVKSDSYYTAAAFVSIPSKATKESRVVLGGTIDLHGFDVTLERAFYKTDRYAVLKIVP